MKMGIDRPANMDNKIAKALIDKYLQSNCTLEEKAMVETWYNQLAAGQKDMTGLPDYEKLHQRISAGLPTEPKRKMVRLWPRIAAAASILVFLSFGLYFYLHQTKTAKLYANDVAPGSTKPVLTLANGQKITLDDKINGTIAQQGAVVIKHNASGQIIYSASNAATTNAPYNTLTNPRGSKVISLILPDGTLAKLEAASSITYQTTFTGKTRQVATTGKVYFAVTYNKNQPFFTTTKGQIIEDLGTHFIVDAYDDEPTIKTTLIEGSVKMNNNNKHALLKPGQQSIFQSYNNVITIKEADLDEETAWINGDFDFNKQDLHSIMRELSRVYNMEIIYKDNVENIVLDGMISRSHNISAVLEMFEATGKVHFEINGRRVMVIAGQR